MRTSTGPDTVKLLKEGVIVLLWGHGDEGRLEHQFVFTGEYQAAVFIGCDAGSVNERIPKQHQLPNSSMEYEKIWRGGASEGRFRNAKHAEYWDQVAIDDAKRKADEWFRDPNGPKEVKFIFVRAEEGYGRCRIHTLTPQNVRDKIELPGWQKLKR
jgi:hypothetical protein